MSIFALSRLRRLAAAFSARLLVLSCALFVGLAAPAGAHEGEDHTHDAPPPPAAVGPRLAVQSELYQVVAALKGGALAIHLDDARTNEPIRGASLTLNIGGEDATALAQGDGLFALASQKLAGAGPLELVFSIVAPGGDDLLIATLNRPQEVAASGLAAPPSPLVLSFAALLVGVALGALLFRRRGGAGAANLSLAGLAPAGLALAGLATLALAGAQGQAFAHEGHDHGAAAQAPALAGDAPQRLPDRSVFLPKPSQRLLEIRTQPASRAPTQKTVSLAGRVIVDPNRGGLVQSAMGGRVAPLEAGLPRLGQWVARGETLARIEPALALADRTTISERLGEIDQAIAMAEAKLRRLKQLSERGAAPQSQLFDTETELDGLRKRREIVRDTRIEPETLRAPVAGVIAAVKAQAGQVVAPQDALFQIVDPKGLLVEALAYADLSPASITRASAHAADGATMELRFVGYGRALQQQASLVHFSIENAPDGLNVGQPLAIVAATGPDVVGVVLPREALVRGPNGESLVWRHVAPEIFEPAPVRSERLDAGRVLVRAGVSEGERIVVRGAELINQVR
jgi:RND family efflux transporter MFP subunit